MVTLLFLSAFFNQMTHQLSTALTEVGAQEKKMSRSSNDDRSDSMNPNNDAYWAAQDNHSDQLNDNNDAYWSSRGKDKDDEED